MGGKPIFAGAKKERKVAPIPTVYSFTSGRERRRGAAIPCDTAIARTLHRHRQHVIIKDDLWHEVGQPVIAVVVACGDHRDEVEGRHNKDSLASLPLRFDPIDPLARYE